MHTRFADVWRTTPSRICNLRAQLFKTFAPHVLKIRTLRPACRALVKVNGNPKLLPDSLASLVRERHAISNRHAAHGNKRQHVRRADTRMNTLMPAQVNQLRSQMDNTQRGFDYYICLCHKRDDGAVVVCIEMQVEHDRARNLFDAARQPLDSFGLAAFTKVRHTLYYFIHASSPPVYVCDSNGLARDRQIY